MIRIAVALALMTGPALAGQSRAPADSTSSAPNITLKGGHYELGWDEGGYLGPYNEKFREIERTGLVVKVKTWCVSACTLVLRNPKACAEPGSVFGFHHAHVEGKPLEDSEGATAALWRHYPAFVRIKVREAHPRYGLPQGH